MRLYNNIIKLAALALGLALVGCSVHPAEDQSVQGREIKFTASVGTFQVKATDSAFELGDAVGLFAGSQIGAKNVRMTWDGTNLVPDTKVFWAPYDGSEIFFGAYYPYVEGQTEDWHTFFVNADQSTHELFTASDFMSATTAASSADGEVNFHFYHRFSKIVIYLDNQLQGLDIADVFVGNVYGRVDGDVWGNYSVVGLPGTIKAGKAVTPAGENVWALIIPSQTTCPEIMITTTDGKQFSYFPDSDIFFGAGYRIGAHVTLDGDSVFTDFTSDVTEWTDNNDLAFPLNDGTVSGWSITGTVHNMDWYGDLPLESCYEGLDGYYALFYYREGDEFKLRKDASWDENLGISGGNGLGGHDGIQDGPNITLPEEGVYELFFYPLDNNYIYIQRLDLTNWGLTGTFEGLGWEGDHFADYSGRFKDDDGTLYPALYWDINYKADDEFKIRFQRTWYLEFGLYWNAGNVLDTNTLYPLEKAGQNIKLPGDGTYRIMFDFCNKTICAELL
jgi:hypothetical protein